MATGRDRVTGATVSTQRPHGVISSHQPDEILYVNKVGSDGWLLVSLYGSDRKQSLSKYTKLKRLEEKDGKTWFRVMDGPRQNEKCGLSNRNVDEYLGRKAPVQKSLNLKVIYGKREKEWVSAARNGEKLDQQWATLLTESGLELNVTMNTVWGTKYFPLPAGEYDILLPDTPHKGEYTGFYRNVAPGLKFDQVWFPIRYGDNSRYIHVGNLSEGCVTVADLERWSVLHEELISHRAPDGKTVAKMKVIGEPKKEEKPNERR